MYRPKTSEEFRDQVVWRNSFETTGPLGFPLVRKQPLPESPIDLISFSDIKLNDNPSNKAKGVHFFIIDPRFRCIYDHPDLSFRRLDQYAFLLTPDYSLYAEMEPWQQIESVGKNRWLGAYWQSRGKLVYPTMSWGSPRTRAFCFDGVEPHSPVAVGMIGCKGSKLDFLRGYNAMLDKIDPSAIICFGEPFPEMEGVSFVVNYLESRKVAR